VPAGIIIALLVLYLLVGEPLLGRRQHRRMLAALAAVTVAIVLGLAGWPHARMGFALPHWMADMPALPSGLIAGFATTGVLDGVFALLFWASGSLLPPLILHVLIDLRILLVRVPASTVIGEQA
jgi:hypothetical protein